MFQKGASSKPGSARKKDDDVDTGPLLVVNNLKHQRVIDEQKLKVLKWNFTTPREEFVELLKDLMTAANVNKTLRANMFHSDFRYHLKAIEALTEVDIDTNKNMHEKIEILKGIHIFYHNLKITFVKFICLIYNIKS